MNYGLIRAKKEMQRANREGPEEAVDREEVIGEGFLEVRLGALAHWDLSRRHKRGSQRLWLPRQHPGEMRGSAVQQVLQGSWREADGEEPCAREDAFPLAAYRIFVNQKTCFCKKKYKVKIFFSSSL